MTKKLEQAARALLAHWDTPAWKYLKPTGDLMADLREALDHSADAGNKVSDHIAGGGKVIPQFTPVGIVNDHHSITWIEEIVDDQAPIGAILYALQDSVGRNVSFAEELPCLQ